MTQRTAPPGRLITTVALFIALAATGARTQDAGLPGDLMLTDQSGTPRLLRAAIGDAGAIVVLCSSLQHPSCLAHFTSLQRGGDTLTAHRLSVLAITREPRSALARFGRQQGVAFPLFTDGDRQVARALGLSARDTGVLVTDARGRIRALRLDTIAGERPTVASLLARAGAAATGPTRRATTAELTITTSISDGRVLPGDVIALVIDVVPRPGMHLYAPGAKGYRGINVRLDAPRALSGRGLVLPPSGMYYFAPLNERVPVYQRPFRAIQELAVTAASTRLADPNLAVAARFEYQACNDELCFEPATIPLTWSVAVAKIDASNK